MKRLNFPLLIIILLTLLAAIGGVLGNAITVPPFVKDNAPLLYGSCVAIMVLFAVIQYLQGQKGFLSSFSSELLQITHANIRGRLLQKVKRDWLDEYVGRYVFTKQVLPVEAFYQSAAVERSTQLHSTSLLPTSSVSLQNLYDLCHDGLLILGSPGAGKTIALVELARTLLEHAKNDEKQPIPVILSLASWDVKRAPLQEWLAQELQTWYQVSLALAQFWIQTGQIVPLLDDFDMVADTSRAACIHAINAYYQQHGLIPLVVCSRSEEYFAQPTRFHLRHAVVLQPLSPSLVERYIVQEHQTLKPIRTLLKRYPQLFNYVRLPRFLDLLARYMTKHPTSSQAYRSLVRSKNFRLVEQELVNSYVQQQLQQIPASSPVTPLQVCQTLHWLALGMKAHHQTLFALDELQPDWLPDEQVRQKAQERVKYLIIFAYMIIGQLNGILLSQSTHAPLMTISFLFGLVAGHQVFKAIKNKKISPTPVFNMSVMEVVAWAWKHKRARFIKLILRMGGICLLMVGGCVTIVSIFFGFLSGWAFGLRTGFLIGIFALVCLFGGGMIGALRIGLVRRHVRRPQDSVWRSARQGMLYGLLLGGGTGSIAFLITESLQFGLKSSQGFAIAIGIGSGLYVWLLCSLMNGGYTLLQYYVLRSLLKKAGAIPHELPLILNVAVQCRLLCLVNSSFMFPHRWLRNYFASHFGKEEKTIQATDLYTGKR
jgi:DNA polymerase III delta prime subunit